jgi:hypothetical protein
MLLMVKIFGASDFGFRLVRVLNVTTIQKLRKALLYVFLSIRQNDLRKAQGNGDCNEKSVPALRPGRFHELPVNVIYLVTVSKVRLPSL